MLASLVEMEPLFKEQEGINVSFLMPCEDLRSGSVCQLAVGGYVVPHEESGVGEADRRDFKCDFGKSTNPSVSQFYH